MPKRIEIDLSAVGGPLADRSNAVVTGGTSQMIMAENYIRRYLLVQNPADQAESLFIDLGMAASATAHTSIEILPGGSYERAAPGFIPTGSVHATAATTNHPFTAKEG